MISGRDEQHRLDALLSGLEDEFLSMDDLEILSEEYEFADIEHLRALIQTQIDACVSINQPQPDTNIRKTSSKSLNKRRKAVPMAVPKEVDRRRRLIESIIASQPNILRKAQVAFSVNEKPTDAAVDDMVTELVRLGLLKKTDTDS